MKMNHGRLQFVDISEERPHRTTQTFKCCLRMNNDVIIGYVEWDKGVRQYCLKPRGPFPLSCDNLAGIRDFILEVAANKDEFQRQRRLAGRKA